MSAFQDRTVVLGVGGGIAAYKVCELARLFVKQGGKVRVAMTPAATRFVAPLTFHAITGHPVLVDLLDPQADSAYGHLALARAADLLVVAPATADLLARLRAGLADDPVTATALAAACPVLLAPAMNTRMWKNPAVQENLQALVARGWHTVGPGSGELADGDFGEGRLAEPEEIAEVALGLLQGGDLDGRRVLVTAGPTREPIDPVRFVSNPSSGKMGFALARVAAQRGAKVVLVSGPVELVDPSGVKVIRVQTAEEMYRACEAQADGIDVFIAAAAVSDYRPKQAHDQKLKKREADETLVLTRTPDILALMGKRFAGQDPAPILVGFAAETQELLKHAREKLRKKACDVVVANKVGKPGSGFGGDTNRVMIVGPNERADIKGTKEHVAEAVLDWVVPMLEARRPRR